MDRDRIYILNRDFFLDPDIITEQHGDVIVHRQRYPGERRNPNSVEFASPPNLEFFLHANAINSIALALAIPNKYFTNQHIDPNRASDADS